MKNKIQVIYKKDYTKIYKKNQIVNVNRGYAFNYLIPNSIVEIATKKKLEHLKMFQKIQEKKILDKKSMFIKQKQCLELINKFNINKKIGETNNIFGSVNEKDITNLILNYSGIKINKRQVKIPVIKQTGSFQINIILTEQISSIIQINILPINF